MTNTLIASHVTIVQPYGDVYHGWVVSRDRDTITLNNWSALYDGDEAPYFAPSGDLVSVGVTEYTIIEEN